MCHKRGSYQLTSSYRYNAGPYYDGQTTWGVGALYLSTASGTKAFYISYATVTPNTTATWVDAGADISNVWLAVRKDIAEEWSQGSTFQWGWYSVNKTVDGVSNYAGQFTIQIQTPTFVKGCDTSCKQLLHTFFTPPRTSVPRLLPTGFKTGYNYLVAYSSSYSYKPWKQIIWFLHR